MMKIKNMKILKFIAIFFSTTFLCVAADFSYYLYISQQPHTSTDYIYEALNVLPEAAMMNFYYNDWNIVTWNDTDVFMQAHGITPPAEYQDYLERTNSHISGITDHRGKKVYIKTGNESGFSIFETTIHEMSHFIDDDLGNLSDTVEFDLLKNHYKYISYDSYLDNRTSDYSELNAQEYFATAFTDYVLHYDYVADHYPILAFYFNKYVMCQYE